MSVTVENLEGLQRRVMLSVQWSDVRSKVMARLKERQKRARIDGFRPGKAPMRMIESIYGPAIQDEVLNDAAVAEFYRLTQEEKWNVASLESLTAAEEQKDESVLNILAVFEVYPEIAINDLSSLKIERIVAEVTDADVDKTIEILRKQRVRYNDVERPAQNGDRVIIDFAGTIDGTPFEGGEAKNYPFVLGEGRMLAEFETGIVGMKEKESQDVSVSFPEDYHGKDVAGKTAVFKITLNKVSEAVLPEVNEDFARSLGIENGDIAKMREEIQKNISREINRRIGDMTWDNVTKALLESHADLQIPNSLVQRESERLRQNMMEQFKSQGMPQAKEDSFPLSMFEERAKQNVHLGLLFAELVDQNQLEANEEQIRAVVAEFAENYEDPQEVIDWYMKDPKSMQNLKGTATERNVRDFVLQKAQVTEKNLSFDEVMAQGQMRF